MDFYVLQRRDEAVGNKKKKKKGKIARESCDQLETLSSAQRSVKEKFVGLLVCWLLVE